VPVVRHPSIEHRSYPRPGADKKRMSAKCVADWRMARSIRDVLLAIASHVRPEVPGTHVQCVQCRNKDTRKNQNKSK
jgi:hypothetical protein